MDITLRPIQPEDMDFLYRLYHSTRELELDTVAWSQEQKAAFTLMQFNAQHQYYQENYTSADFLVILAGGEPAGRLYIARWPEEIRIVDIALLPEYRNHGIGTRLLKELLAEGERAGKPVSIHVESFNPARRLYERLGFAVAADKGVYLLMQWSPPSAGAANPDSTP